MIMDSGNLAIVDGSEKAVRGVPVYNCGGGGVVMDVGTAQDLCAAGRSSPTGAIPCTACAAGRLVVEMSSCVTISPLYNNNGIIKR